MQNFKRTIIWHSKYYNIILVINWCEKEIYEKINLKSMRTTTAIKWGCIIEYIWIYSKVYIEK